MTQFFNIDKKKTTSKNIPDLRLFSVQVGLLNPADRSFTPESCRSLLLRSSSSRLEDWELRTEHRAS